MGKIDFTDTKVYTKPNADVMDECLRFTQSARGLN